MQPSDFCAIIRSASCSVFIPSLAAIPWRCDTMSADSIRLKSYIWQRDSMVGRILCFSVVARMNIACAGGSSSVFRNALNAACDSMCTSSMMYTLYLPTWGGMRTCSLSERIPSTELLLAASSSYIEYERCWLNDWHDSHLLHGSPSPVGARQLIVFAKILAQVVFPTPRGPQNRYACASFPLWMAFLSVVVSDFCATTDSKLSGRYFLAETI